MTKCQTPESQAYEFVLEQHIENTSFLWELHSNALNQPHYFCDDLVEIEKRINAHIKGLLPHSKEVWSLCESALELEGPGDIFVSAIIAFHSNNHNNLQTVINIALTHPDKTKGFVSALCWLPQEQSKYWLGKLLKSQSTDHKFLSIEAHAYLRLCPGDYLITLFDRPECQQNEALIHSAIRLIGVLKIHNSATILKNTMSSSNIADVFWASWSIVFFGEKQNLYKQAIDNLQSAVLNPGPFQNDALEILFRCLSVLEARALIKKMAKSNQTRLIIQALSILGDPQSIPWLLDTMPQKAYSRIAAEAYCLITGADLEKDSLHIDPAENSEPSPYDDPDDMNTDMDEDENVPWPNIDALKHLWQNISPNFENGKRYFMGKTASQASYLQFIETGNQRQRNSAALSLALMDTDQHFVNTKSRVS